VREAVVLSRGTIRRRVRNGGEMDIVRPRRVVVVIVSWRIGTVLLNREMALGMIRDMLGWVYMLYMSARDTSVAVV
jgi:hypothetical protein